MRATGPRQAASSITVTVPVPPGPGPGFGMEQIDSQSRSESDSDARGQSSESCFFKFDTPLQGHWQPEARATRRRLGTPSGRFTEVRPGP